MHTHGAQVQTVPTENYFELVDTAEEALMQISEQLKVMTITMDAVGFEVPHFKSDDKWLKDFKENSERLFLMEKPWIKAGQKNLSSVVKGLYLFLMKRCAELEHKQISMFSFGAAKQQSVTAQAKTDF